MKVNQFRIKTTVFGSDGYRKTFNFPLIIVI